MDVEQGRWADNAPESFGALDRRGRAFGPICRLEVAYIPLPSLKRDNRLLYPFLLPRSHHTTSLWQHLQRITLIEWLKLVCCLFSSLLPISGFGLSYERDFKAYVYSSLI